MRTMEQQNATANPHSWASGPPESKSESWNWERRSELLNIASGLLQAQVMGAMKRGEPWQDEAGQNVVSPRRAVELAKELIDETERIQPKL